MTCQVEVYLASLRLLKSSLIKISMTNLPLVFRNENLSAFFPRAREAMFLSNQVQPPPNLLAITYRQVKAWVSVVSFTFFALEFLQKCMEMRPQQF